VPALLMESLVTIQRELAALKKEVIELRRINDLQRERRRSKRARQKERRTQKEDPREEGQDQAEGTHITAAGAGVVMSCRERHPQQGDTPLVRRWGFASSQVTTPPVWWSGPGQFADGSEEEAKGQI